MPDGQTPGTVVSVDVQAIVAQAIPGPDPKAALEQAQFIRESEWHAAKLRSFTQDIEERKTYANKIYRMLAWFLAGVFALLLMSAMPKGCTVALPGVSPTRIEGVSLGLADGVLIALIGGTTASVIGLFAIVANYLFPKKGSGPDT